MHSVLDYLNDTEPIELAQQLIRIPSFLWKESDVAYFIADWCRSRCFDRVEVQAVPLRDGSVTHQVIAGLDGAGGPSLMLCGHTDTSDWQGRPFREAEWTHNPFGGEVEDGYLYGLGAINMKSGLASMLVAADAIRRARDAGHLRLKGALVVACVVAETGGGVGAMHLINTGLRPDYCIVTEATNLDVGVISVGYVQGKIKVIGEFKHRTPYINPIEKAAKVIQTFGPAYHPLPHGGWLRFDPHPLLPGFPRMAVRNIEHFQDITTLVFDLRIVPGMTEDTVREDMQRLLERIAEDDADFRFELIIPQSAQQPNMPAREATPVESPLTQAIIAAHEAVTGSTPNVGAGHRIGATADTCHFKGVGITCVEYGPGFIPVWPMVDERIEVTQVVTATKVLALAAERLVAISEKAI
ncbi:MAG: acetylornithine deacetylase [Candidatus Roseilinea sp.]|nr:MAG: acetylornithine deacetylase [Candidatus Roseilinea sp.]